jgi:prepilin-type N-terminal cleavage/methylation domain-containing protein
MFPQQASERLCVAGGACPEPVEQVSRRPAHQLRIVELRLLSQRERARAFTLLELLIVIGIIAVLLVLIAPAFTTIKSAGDVTSAAYTIKGALDTARTYAKANNTYAWVGFAGSVGPNTQQSVTGQVKLAIVASKDGTNLWSANNALPPASLTQIGKMMTLDNIHIGDTGTPTNDGTDFESRASVDSDHRISTSPNTPYPFTVQQTTFNKWIQFSPRGEALVHGGSFSIVKDTEVGVLPTHATALAVTQSGNVWLGNVVAIQIKGFAGDVRIYRR